MKELLNYLITRADTTVPIRTQKIHFLLKSNLVNLVSLSSALVVLMVQYIRKSFTNADYLRRSRTTN